MGAAGFAARQSLPAAPSSPRPARPDRGRRTDGATLTTVEEQADDLHRLITNRRRAGGHVRQQWRRGGCPALGPDIRSRCGYLLRTSLHAAVLPDAEPAMAPDIHETYLRSGFGAGMAKFIALTSHKGRSPRTGRSTRPTSDVRLPPATDQGIP
jgi:hypothetical protein